MTMSSVVYDTTAQKHRPLGAAEGIVNFYLPQPKVGVIAGAPHTGTFLSGQSTKCFSTIQVNLEDLPISLFSPHFELQLELGKWVRSKSRRRTGEPTRKVAAGFKHPACDVVGNPHRISTRGGRHTANTVRQTEWPLAAARPNALLNFPIGDCFAPWFDLYKLVDSAGNTTDVARYTGGKKSTHTVNDKGYPNVGMRGVFAFRYSVYDVNTNTRINGVWSERVYCQPLRWPTMPSGNFPRDSQIDNAQLPAVDYHTWLVASMSTAARGNI